jgi:hypothetical protein
MRTLFAATPSMRSPAWRKSTSAVHSGGVALRSAPFEQIEMPVAEAGGDVDHEGAARGLDVARDDAAKAHAATSASAAVLARGRRRESRCLVMVWSARRRRCSKIVEELWRLASLIVSENRGVSMVFVSVGVPARRASAVRCVRRTRSRLGRFP